MGAYVIFLRESTTNEQGLKTYTDLAIPTLQNRPVIVRTFYGALDVLEGPQFGGVVMLEFPTVQEAKAWYCSPEYQAAAIHRKASAIYRAFIVEGVPPSQSQD